MLIWILALVLLALGGFCGYKLGAVKSAVSWAGLMIAAGLALPLGPFLKPVVPLIGLKNPIWPLIVPPVLAFLIIYLVFFGISFVVDRKVGHYFKYSADDGERFAWLRVSRAVGLWIGLMSGAVWLFLIGVAIYVAGYFTVQVKSDETNSMLVSFLSQAREDMHSTGFDKAVAPFDPASPRYYEASDLLGLVYQNPILIGRLSQYPPFLLLGEKQEIQDLAKDTDFNQMLLTKGDVVQIIKHPKLQAIMLSPEIVQDLLGQDLKDLRTYLETGISPKYQDDKILGRWVLDPYATMAQERKRNPDLSSTEMRQLKKVMIDVMPGVSFTATTDNKVNLKADVSEKLKQLFQAPKPAAPAQPAPMSGIDSRLSARYGVRYGQGGQPAVAAPPPTPAAQKNNEIRYLVYSAQGSWERDGQKYQLKMQDEKGKNSTLEASADDDRLTVFTPNVVLVFTKAS